MTEKEYVLRITGAPGTVTRETAQEATDAWLELLQAVADEIAPGAIIYRAVETHWIDDGRDEIVLRVTHEVQP